MTRQPPRHPAAHHGERRLAGRRRQIFNCYEYEKHGAYLGGMLGCDVGGLQKQWASRRLVCCQHQLEHKSYKLCMRARESSFNRITGVLLYLLQFASLRSCPLINQPITVISPSRQTTEALSTRPQTCRKPHALLSAKRYPSTPNTSGRANDFS